MDDCHRDAIPTQATATDTPREPHITTQTRVYVELDCRQTLPSPLYNVPDRLRTSRAWSCSVPLFSDTPSTVLARATPYAIGVVISLIAAGVRVLLGPYLGDLYPFVHCYPAVFAAAWLAGARGGLTATAISIVATQFLVRVPYDSGGFTVPDAVAAIIFVASSLVVSLLAQERLRAVSGIEAERAEAAARAAGYREWLDNLVAEVPAVVWEAWGQPDAAAQRINFVNRHVERLLGYTVEEWLSTPNFWLTIVHPDDRDRAGREAHGFFESRQGGTSRFRWMRKDGREIWVEAQSKVIVDALGNPVGMRGVTLDVSDSIKLQAERADLLRRTERARQDAENANRLKDDFLMTLSHELRTPLNAIWGWARMLRTSGFDENRRARALEVIERNARAQLGLVEDLLDVSRMVTGKLRLHVQPYDVATVLTAVLDTVRPTADAKGVALGLTIETLPGPLAGDADRIQQAVWNLVSNAVKFTSVGGRVDVELRRVHASVEITVRDTGIGVAPDLLPLIFERFRQADTGTSRAFTGLGLGLSIARTLVEAHGGTIDATSDGLGCGSAFRIVLPLALPLGDIQVRETLAMPAESSGIDVLHGARILVVDDDPYASELVEMILRDAGAVVQTETSADAGYRSISAFRPGLIVSDIEMPGEDGYSFMRRIRAAEDGTGLTTPAVALTAYVREDDRRRALEAGFHAHVAKPLDAAAFTTVVRSLLAVSSSASPGDQARSTP